MACIMRTVLQYEDKNDCGVACVAMLAGVSYDIAAEAISKFGECDYVKRSCIIDALKTLGVTTVSDRLVSLRMSRRNFVKRSEISRNLAALNADALLKLVRRDHKNGHWHWVVWDSCHNRIRDPLGDHKRSLCRVDAYIKIANRRFGLRGNTRRFRSILRK